MGKLCYLRPFIWLLVVLLIGFAAWKVYARGSIHQLFEFSAGDSSLTASIDSSILQLSSRGYQLLSGDDSILAGEDFEPHKSGQLKSKFKVFGWYPYWVDPAYEALNYDLLWGIAYFGYEINPDDGSYTTIRNWDSTAMIDSAQAHNCKVYLSLINFGTYPNHKFLNDTAAQENLITQTIALLKQRNATGAVVDFEQISKVNRDVFSSFIVRLSQALHKENFELVVTLYAVDHNQVFDIGKLYPVADHFVMMGYGYSYAKSLNAAPNAPLSGTLYNLEESVTYYLKQGLPKDQFIVALPYFGNVWEVLDSEKGARTKSFVSSAHYNRLSEYDTAQALLDKETDSKYLSYEVDSQWHQLWYDDEETLNRKQQWIKQQGLAGMGIWALGYDHGTKELWALIRKNFGKPKPIRDTSSVQ